MITMIKIIIQNIILPPVLIQSLTIWKIILQNNEKNKKFNKQNFGDIELNTFSSIGAKRNINNGGNIIRKKSRKNKKINKKNKNIKYL